MIQKLAKINIYLAISILVLVPFHAILSIVAYTLIGHYTLTRLFEEYILLCMVLSGVYIFIKDFKNQKKLLNNKLILLILGYLLLLIIFALLGYLNKSVNLKATFYGLLLDSRYLIYFLLIYQAIKTIDLKDFKNKINIFKLILIPAALVIGFGLLQVFVLPYDFLAHLGYSKDTIHAYYVVNNNYKYIRILSTLRGPNPLGAYMIFPAIFILSYIVKNKRDYKNYLFLIATLIVLYYSYSRSSVIGIAIAMAIYLYLKFDNERFKKIFRIIAISSAIIFSAVFILFRNNYYFQNIVFHTQKNSIYKSTSNNGHKQGIISGLSNIAHHPFGNGVGSAGQASVYNLKPAVISEDYFLQIGEETGVFGLALFLAIIYFVLRNLFIQKDNYSKIAFSIFSGMLIISLFWFTLSDETLCFSLFAVLAFALAKDKTSILKA